MKAEEKYDSALTALQYACYLADLREKEANMTTPTSKSETVKEEK